MLYFWVEDKKAKNQANPDMFEKLLIVALWSHQLQAAWIRIAHGRIFTGVALLRRWFKNGN